MSISDGRVLDFFQVGSARLSYLTVGAGPGVVVVPGALTTAADYTSFADTLAASFQVHVLNRRGRGGSVPQGPDYDLAQEAGDVCDLLETTGSRILVGHSFGGLIALEVARSRPELQALILFEPGVSVDGSIPMGWVEPCRNLLAQHRAMDAFVEYVAGTGPSAGKFVPRWLLKRILTRAIPAEDLKRMVALLPECLAEHQQIARVAGSTARYTNIGAPTLLLAGEKTRVPYLTTAIEALRNELARSTTAVMRGVDHFAILNRGAPDVVAGHVHRFLDPSWRERR